jgi:hypothetical protein
MESIGTLAGGLAHDLNNVLAPILMSIDLLKAFPHGPAFVGTPFHDRHQRPRGADMIQVLSYARGMEGRPRPGADPSARYGSCENRERDLSENIRIESRLGSRPLDLGR